MLNVTQEKNIYCMIIAEIKNKKDYLESQFLKLRFPVVLRQLLDCTPSKRRPGIFMSLMPIMSLYCNRLRLQYPLDNGKVTAPVVQCYVYGSSAAGKGKVEEFQTLLAAKLSEMDSKERAEEEAFLAKKRESSSKKKTRNTARHLCVHLSRKGDIFHNGATWIGCHSSLWRNFVAVSVYCRAQIYYLCS